MEIECLTGILGARATGIDLRKLGADDEGAADLRAAICANEVLVVP